MTVFFDTPVDKSLGATGTWTDIDLSLNVPAGATGAIFQIINTVVDNPQKFGLRKKGGTDNRYKGIDANSATFALIGIDANRKCQGKIDVTDVDFYLVGYTLNDAVFFTNAYDKSQSTTGTWTDLDLSAEVPAGTVAVIFEIVNTGTSDRSWGMRKKGSTDNLYGELAEGCHLFFVIGVDGNRKCEFKIESWLVDFYLLGYLTAGVAETNGIDRSLGSTGSYIDITETNAPNNATGAYGQLYTSQVWQSYAARKNGSSWDKYKATPAENGLILVGLDGDKKWEGKISNTSVDFYTLGYFSLGGIDKFSSDVGVGTDALSNLQAAVVSAEAGAGADSVSESLSSRVESETGIGVDVLVGILKAIAKCSSDTGVGTDTNLDVLADLVQSDYGIGIESLGSRVFGSQDEGVGVDELLELALSGADSGIGSDDLKALLAAVQESDAGVGEEANAIEIYIYLLLKLLQKRRISIALSQMGLAGGRGGNGVMDYIFQKKCTVVATVAGAQTNYQMELIVGESSGAVGAGVHCNAHCQDFPNDIRFTKEDGLTKHDYWVESITGISPNRLATVVIEVALIPVSGSVDFYMYYGMSDDSGESNSANTFLNSDEYKRPDTSGAYFEDFLDDNNEESHSNITYSVHKPVKYSGNPVLSGGTWDAEKNYNDVQYIDGKFKMWYTGRENSAPHSLRICYAESDDGITWTRPNLGIIVYGGNTNNNIIIADGRWGPSVYYDEDAANPDRKYTLLTPLGPGVPCGTDQGIYFSPDGKNFTFGKVIFGPNPECNGHSESMSLNRLSDGRWIAYTQRYDSRSSLRTIGARISVTDDIMGDWVDYGVIIPEINTNLQRYSMGVTQKHDRFYGFLNCYNKSTEKTEMALWTSRNGLTWEGKDSSWVPRGDPGTWDQSMIFDGESLVKVANEWWYYYSGFKNLHNHGVPFLAHIGLAKIDYERIGSIHAAVGGGSYEDFTTFTEVDVAADRIQKTAQHVDHLAYRNETTYLYKDYGVAHFDDFTHKIKIQLVGGGDTYSMNICWGLSDILDDASAIETGGNTQIVLYLAEAAGSVLKVVLRESHSSVGYYDLNEGGFNIGDWVYAKIVKSWTSLNVYLYSDSAYTTLVDTLTLTLQADHTFRYLYACNTWNTGAAYAANTNIENFDLGGGGAGVEGTFISKNFFTLNSLKLNADASGGGTLKLELLDVNNNPVTGYTKADFDTISTNGYEFVPAWGGETGLPSQPVKLKFYLAGAYLYSYLADCSTISYSDPIDDLGGDWIENPDNSAISNELLALTEGGLNDEWYQRKVRQIQNENIDYKIEARLKTSVTNSTGYLFCMGGGNKQWSIFLNSDGKIYYVHSGGTVDCGGYVVDTWYIFSIVHKTTGVVDYYINGDLKASDQAGLVHSSWRIAPREFGFGTSYSNTCILNVDWVIVRKYSSPEPTWGVWGNEEERGIAFFQLKLLQEKVLNMKLSQIGMIL